MSNNIFPHSQYSNTTALSLSPPVMFVYRKHKNSPQLLRDKTKKPFLSSFKVQPQNSKIKIVSNKQTNPSPSMAVSEEECSSVKSRSSSSASSSATTTHYLAKCVLRGSVVLQVLYGHIRSPTFLDVVFAKVTFSLSFFPFGLPNLVFAPF